MQNALNDKVVIVTGAAGGIGSQSVLTIARAGAKVVASDIDARGLATVTEQARSEGLNVESIQADLSSEESIRSLVEQTVNTFGRLDGAFNNAAIEQCSKPLTDLSLDEWNRAIRINLTGTFICLKYQIPAMLVTGGGSIVNTSSAAAEMAFPHGSEYISAKAGLLGLTRAAAVDYGAQGIRVNAILPGVIRTPMVQRLCEEPQFKEMMERARERHLLRRFGEPAEVGQVAAWLLSDAAAFVQGASISVDGGFCVNGG